MRPCLDPKAQHAPSNPFCYSEPAQWVVEGLRFLEDKTHPVLDLACGAGRHTRFMLDLGLQVVAADIDLTYMARFVGEPHLELQQVDLEHHPWIWLPETFGAIVVTNYLHRPLFPSLYEALVPGGLLIYETFTTEHTRLYGRPRRPEHVLKLGELKTLVPPQAQCLAYGEGPTTVKTMVAHGVWRKPK